MVVRERGVDGKPSPRLDRKTSRDERFADRRDLRRVEFERAVFHNLIPFWDNPESELALSAPRINSFVRRVDKSLRSAKHRVLIDALVRARGQAGLTQQQLAAKLGKSQSFVAKYETGERRLDVIEFLAIVAALGADPHKILEALQSV